MNPDNKSLLLAVTNTDVLKRPKDPVLAELFDFVVKDQTFQEELHKFFEAHVGTFNNSFMAGKEQEHQHVYKDLHDEYHNLYGTKLDRFLHNKGLSEREFAECCQKVTEDKVDGGNENTDNQFLDHILAAADYDTFLKMMQVEKITQLQAQIRRLMRDNAQLEQNRSSNKPVSSSSGDGGDSKAAADAKQQQGGTSATRTEAKTSTAESKNSAVGGMGDIGETKPQAGGDGGAAEAKGWIPSPTLVADAKAQEATHSQTKSCK